MRLPVSWLRTFVDVPGDPQSVAARLGSCGFATEAIEGDVLDLDVTANRPDCLSVYGLAREAATAFDRDLTAPPVAEAPVGRAPIAVSIADAACGRYALAVVDVTVAPSPAWMSDRLLAAGVRPINNIVDVTNYVMLELGQPMHAFDAARLAGPEIHVRRARPSEVLTTIDGEQRTLDETMLVIADRDRAVAIAGVMGGMASEVTAGTTRIALESAWFLPASVRATARKLALKTEASARFERGADIGAAVQAIQRALELFAAIGAGRVSGAISDACSRPPEPRRVPLRRARIARLLGAPIPDADVERILGRLAFRLTAQPDGWAVDVPSFRVDVSREADVIEEVARHWGLDALPSTFPPLHTVPRPSDAGIRQGREVRRLLCGAGVQEAVTFTFIDEAAAQSFATGDPLVRLTNPLSEKFATLRPSLVPGLVESLVYNRNRQASDIRLFEIGSTFSRAGEGVRVGWVLSGSRGAHWSGSAGALTFADTKGLAELLAAGAGVELTVAPADDLAWLAAGERAAIVIEGRRAGWIGRLAAHRAGDEPIYAGEVALEALVRDATRPRPIAPLPRHPAVVRDLSILVDHRLPAADVRGTIRSQAPSTLVSVREFDRYDGKGIPEGFVSLSIRLTFRHADRTLTDAEVQQAVDAIVAALGDRHGARLRGH